MLKDMTVLQKILIGTPIIANLLFIVLFLLPLGTLILMAQFNIHFPAPYFSNYLDVTFSFYAPCLITFPILAYAMLEWVLEKKWKLALLSLACLSSTIILTIAMNMIGV